MPLPSFPRPLNLFLLDLVEPWAGFLIVCFCPPCWNNKKLKLSCRITTKVVFFRLTRSKNFYSTRVTKCVQCFSPSLGHLRLGENIGPHWGRFFCNAIAWTILNSNLRMRYMEHAVVVETLKDTQHFTLYSKDYQSVRAYNLEMKKRVPIPERNGTTMSKPILGVSQIPTRPVTAFLYPMISMKLSL
jgi:hypothetical protein